MSFKIKTRNVLSRQTLYRTEIPAVFGRGDGYCLTLASGASGSSDAVDVIFGAGRHVKIEDMAHRLNIESPCRNVGADQIFDLAGLEGFECIRAAELIHVAMQGAGIEAVPF